MTKLANLVVAGLLLTTASASAKPIVPRQVLGFVSGSAGVSVVKLDATTLRPLSRAAPSAGASAFLAGTSIAGARAAIWTATRGGTLRILDLRRMRWEGGLAVPGGVITTLWNYADRLVAVTGGPTAAVLVIDPISRRIRAQHALRGPIAAIATTSEDIVAAVAPLDGIGAVRLVVVDDLGHVRQTPLAQIRAGGAVGQVAGPEPFVGLFERPALATDGSRAIAISADGSVADVRLSTLTVTSARLGTRTLARTNKMAEGHARSAVWLGEHTVAVTGSDASIENGKQRWAPAGLKLVDTRDWSVRVLDSTSTDAQFNGLRLLGFGGYWISQEDGVSRAVGDGLSGYGSDGSRLFHVFEGRLVRPVCVSGAYAYFAEQNATRFTIVNTQTGAIAGTAQTRTPTALAPLFRF